MAQLYFRYGAMNSSKSLNLIATAHNYETQGKAVMVLNSPLDTRSGKGLVSSRAGLEWGAIPFKPTDTYLDVASWLDELEKLYNKHVSCILVDEAQLLTPDNIDVLADIVDNRDIPVICYGLKTDFKTDFFPGSQRLLQVADKIEEVKTTCVSCDNKAVLNLRTVDGVAVYEGDQVEIGDDAYFPVCRDHYYTWNK